MAESSAQERTEQPTPKRQQEAREKGQVPRSRELSTTVLLLSSALGLLLMGEFFLQGLAELMRQGLRLERAQIFEPAAAILQFQQALWEALKTITPFLFLTLIAALAAPLLMGGWSFSFQALGFKWEKLDPLKGMKRVFGPQGWMELLKALAKFLLLGGIACVLFWYLGPDLIALGRQGLIPALYQLAHLMGWSFLGLSASLVLIAAIDAPFQHWHHTRQLKMTHQEIKEEHKETEGSPELKARVRRVQREIAGRRMMAAVPQANVVVTNPTHYAVALDYQQDKGGAPRVVAKGADQVALKIRAVAAANNVPVLSAPSLSRALYYNTELNQEIPAGLYVAVAQVLAYVFQLRRYQRQGGIKPASLPDEFPIPEDLRRD
ncbi:flagellar biosynthetic protein FlhB [Nitrosococcus halophilus Nc 4]|uniref:Flagellar biosynthetic protein FlhB n=1 Tax=Nitrosococcus halophilus (strain Nc4) TaxID=472759 RepID=D5C248_NITHN|nr:flagellar biosynthesis protein FlhB [Nitrosococcus halophilus]ADE16636.1 flagellar biosynthetic protein FlhB [Nitrosococcus halophilus Nc 4]